MIIKVCGMRDPENIRLVEALDIDLMGFIFYAGSPRYVSDTDACAETIRRCGKPKVGVFVNETLENVIAKVESYHLDYVQLHGKETPEFCAALRRRGYRIVKAFSVASADDLLTTENYADCADYFLFDAKCASYGGSGRRFDWSLLDAYQGDAPFLLSGGLSPGCESEIRRLAHPRFAGIDLNSGFELSPAVKNVDTLERFIFDVRV